MKGKRVYKKLDWSPEDRARHKAIRDKLQQDKPSLEEIKESGEYFGPVLQGAYLEMLQTFAALKKAREASGLSIADVSERTGLDEATLTQLENGKQPNPTVDAIHRYALAVGKEVRWLVQDAAAADK